MSEVKKEIASALKWVFVIIVAAIAYKSVYTTESPYRFLNNKKYSFIRANTITGKVECLNNLDWVPVNEKSNTPDFYAELDEEDLDLIPLDDDYVPVKNYVRK